MSTHKEIRRWYCPQCKKFYQLHSDWNKHMFFWHDQPQYKSDTYVTRLYNVEAGDKCEGTFIKADAEAEKRRLNGQTGGPPRKKRKVAIESGAVKAILDDEGLTAKNIVDCVVDEVLAEVGMPSELLTLSDEQIVGVIVNGVTLASEDFNDNTDHDGSNVVEMLITELDNAAEWGFTF